MAPACAASRCRGQPFDPRRIVGAKQGVPRRLPAMRTNTRTTDCLIEPGDPAWTAATGTFDLTVAQEPALVALPETEADVVAVVDFAREHGMQVAPQRTGHNAKPLGPLD